jgi:hypothetical protein
MARKETADELHQLKADELRARAKAQGIARTSHMKKDELIEALRGGTTHERTHGGSHGETAQHDERATRREEHGRRDEGGGEDGEPIGDSKAVHYAQHVSSPEQHEERAGRSLATRNHEVIKRWAEERGATPATIPGTEHEGRPGVLRFDFPGYSGQELKKVSWEEWFAVFDERKLNFIYQEHKSDGSQSNFFRLDNPEREDA